MIIDKLCIKKEILCKVIEELRCMGKLNMKDKDTGEE